MGSKSHPVLEIHQYWTALLWSCILVPKVPKACLDMFDDMVRMKTVIITVLLCVRMNYYQHLLS